MDSDSDSWEKAWIRIRDARIRTSLVCITITNFFMNIFDKQITLVQLCGLQTFNGSENSQLHVLLHCFSQTLSICFMLFFSSVWYLLGRCLVIACEMLCAAWQATTIVLISACQVTQTTGKQLINMQVPTLHQANTRHMDKSSKEIESTWWKYWCRQQVKNEVGLQSELLMGLPILYFEIKCFYKFILNWSAYKYQQHDWVNTNKNFHWQSKNQ